MQTAIYGLSVLGTFGLFAAGILYSSHKIASIWAIFATVVIYSLAFTLYWHQSVAQEKKNHELPEKAVQLTEPTFSEDVDQVSFSLGERGVTTGYKRSVLEQFPKEPFNFGGYKPVKIYIENGKLYANVTIFGGTGLPPIEVRHNKLIGKPPNWDMNSNFVAMEIVNENMVPMYQFIYKTSSHIIINGIFPFPGGLMLANDKGMTVNPSLPTEFSIKRIFKYPSWKYPGEYAGDAGVR